MRYHCFIVSRYRERVNTMSYKLMMCEVCDNEFYAKSSRAKYCSKSCKQKNWRRSEGMRNHAKRINVTFDDKMFVDAWKPYSEEMVTVLDEAIAEGQIEAVRALKVLMSERVVLDSFIAIVVERGCNYYPVAELASIPF